MAGAMDTITDIATLEGWIPIQLYAKAREPQVDWAYLGKRQFREPFFSETVEDSLRLPFNLLFRHQTSIEVLRRLYEEQPGISPAGFIFHMSRCGSTLVSQMLASVPGNIVISEASPIDSVLRGDWGHELTNDGRVELLRWMVSALAQPRMGNERRFFVKFDAWNILHLPLIRQAFPDTPWIFLYRDPIEVLVSQSGRLGAHMIPTVIPPDLFGIDFQTLNSLSPQDYCSRVLAATCEAALRHSPSGGRLINYAQLPEVVWLSVLDFFGVKLTEDDLATMKAAVKFDSKNPLTVFNDDRPRKRDQATESLRAAADRWLYPIYEQLEAARLAPVGEQRESAPAN